MRVWFYAVVTVIAALLLAGCLTTGDKPQRDTDVTDATIAVPTSFAVKTVGGGAPDGWVRFEGTRTSISMPEGYSGGTAEDLQFLLEQARSIDDELGEAYTQSVEALAANPGAIDLLIFADELSADGGVTNVIVLGERVLSTVSLDDYADLISDGLPSSWEVTQPKELTVDDEEVRVVEAEFTVETITGKQAYYLRKVGSTVWAVVYSGSAEEWSELEPTFRRSYDTFIVESP